jgi:starch synthase
VRSGRSIWVAHPGAASSVYELVASIARLGFGARFETGFYYSGAGWLARLVASLPAKYRAKLERELKRRQFAGLDAVVMRQHALLELAYVLSARLLPRKPELSAKLMHWRNERFDKAVGRRVIPAKPSLIVAQDTSALHTIRAAKQAGTISILHQMIGHLAVGARILKEEAALQPDWADSLHADAPPWLIEQCRAEAVEADHVIASSDYVRQTLIEVGAKPERVHLLPYGVRVDKFRPADAPRNDGKFRLLYVGQISQRKGLSYLLDAIKQIGDREIELTLVGGIVGAGNGLKKYDGLYRHVRNVPHSEVIALFRDADAFVYPSLHEGSALAIYEALASGLPVITTLNSGSVVRDGIEGRIVPIRDSQALVEKILELKNNPDLRRTMALAARARAEEFTWDRYRERLGELLDLIG